MSNNYNFDEVDQEDRPTIVMGGLNYKLRYPTVEEVEKLQNLKTDEERTAALYSFIEAEDEKQEKFESIIKKQDIRVFRKFSDMIKTEFGVE